MSQIFDLKARLTEMGLEPKKAFGQNFLVNRHVIGKIVDRVKHTKFTDMVEVGPGLGALTEPILKLGFKPLLIELDQDLIEYWKTRDLDLIGMDALKVNWDELGLREGSLFVSNLPYQISTSIVIDRCMGPSSIQHMILMFQKEVAQRLTASTRTKDYGMLSVMAQLYFKMQKVSEASPGDFFPPPKIASRVLAFERRPVDIDGPKFLNFVKHAFAFRRKFLIKNLKSVVDKTKIEGLKESLISFGLTEMARAEELTPEQFVLLFRKVNE